MNRGFLAVGIGAVAAAGVLVWLSPLPDRDQQNTPDSSSTTALKPPLDLDLGWFFPDATRTGPLPTVAGTFPAPVPTQAPPGAAPGTVTAQQPAGQPPGAAPPPAASPGAPPGTSPPQGGPPSGPPPPLIGAGVNSPVLDVDVGVG